MRDKEQRRGHHTPVCSCDWKVQAIYGKKDRQHSWKLGVVVVGESCSRGKPVRQVPTLRRAYSNLDPCPRVRELIVEQVAQRFDPGEDDRAQCTVLPAIRQMDHVLRTMGFAQGHHIVRPHAAGCRSEMKVGHAATHHPPCTSPLLHPLHIDV